ncbi:gamma-glutamyltransferase family protein [Microvirga massiliensis]|uniref:gamma-glutamyltransferase family protein n=1 Tax=Microvirga massiliensis TaxID=1033741 RepID=UPI00062BDF78|nr:gamma-glutamyltransferase family protein [Microvirga massiliensis]
MLQTRRSFRGMVTAPHDLAARAGLRVLEDGGTCIEAMVAAAAAIAVVYPHMNGLGGDSFWLISLPGEAPVGIDACGAAARGADIGFYREQGHAAIPSRGSLAALTVAGAVSGWEQALEVNRRITSKPLPLSRLLEDAIEYARQGIPVTRSQSLNTSSKLHEFEDVPGFASTFLIDRHIPAAGERFRQPRLAATLEHLARAGLDDFYRGDLAEAMSSDLERAGSPLRLEDLRGHKVRNVEPLSTEVGGHQVFNLPPPTQGVASLLVLGIYDRLGVREAENFEFVHGLVEATKQAFRIRDRHVCDPDYMTEDPRSFLKPEALDAHARVIDRRRAAPWPHPSAHGDTVWLGAIDGEGRAVSFIQSLYWEFGSGVVLPESGITWQNRGTSFSLDEPHLNHLRPGRRPFHTIQPALARLADGRTMVYGTMGGEGQPQTQAAVFARHVLHGQELQQAVTAPRWLLGRTWGTVTTNLKIESRFDPTLIAALQEAGHDVEVVGPFEEIMGHAGALVHHPSGLIEGASDPRSDGAALGF